MDNKIWNNYVFINSAKTRQKILNLLYYKKTPLTVKEIHEELNQEHNLSQISKILKELNEKNLIEILNTNQQYGNIYQINYYGMEIMDILLGKKFKEEVKKYFIKQGYNIVKIILKSQRIDLVLSKNDKLAVVIFEYLDHINDGMFKRRLEWLIEARRFYGADFCFLTIKGYFSKDQRDKAIKSDIELIDNRKLNLDIF